jgi:hypothetical protein
VAGGFLFVENDKGEIVDVVQLESWEKPSNASVPGEWKQYCRADDSKPDSLWNRKWIYDDNNEVLLLPGYSVRTGTRKERDAWIASRPDPTYSDIIGRPVRRGSRVAVAFALGRGAEIRVGRVVGFDLLLKASGGYNHGGRGKISPREQIVVEWETDNRNWSSLDKGTTTKIFAGLRRYVVIE